jgi:ribonuclease P protein component
MKAWVVRCYANCYNAYKHMIPREYRLKHMKDFDILFKQGRFVRGNFVNAKVWKLEPEKYVRRKYTTEDLKFGFVVSKKVSKRAVVRNKIKRRMREAMRLIIKETELSTGYHVSFMAAPGADAATFDQIMDDVSSILKKSRIL